MVVANLPYNISTPLLFQFLEARARIQRMVLTLQLEVAKRLVAPVGTRDYGVLSVLIQSMADVRLAFQVTKSCFRPAPKVDSAVVRLDIKARGIRTCTEEEAIFVEIVRAAFAHRRKTLSNSMRDAGISIPEILLALKRSEIDHTRRAETLTIQEFEHLSKTVLNIRRSP